MNDDQHWRIYRTLRDLEENLHRLVDRDPEQEATGIAIQALDAVVDEAIEQVGDPVREHIVSVVSPEQLAEGMPPRAADVLIVVGILKSRIGRPPSAARARLDRGSQPRPRTQF